MKLVIATTNLNKLREYQKILAKWPLNVVGINQVKSIPHQLKIEENGKTFQENAVIKAKAYGKLSKWPVIADDSGLMINYLNGKPGVKSARFAAGNFALAMKKILEKMTNVPRSKRQAKFVCAIAYYDRKSQILKTFLGTSHGLISQSEAGSGGFGYDSIFWHPKLKKTFAQATDLEKNKLSHRAKALEKLKSYLIIS